MKTKKIYYVIGYRLFYKGDNSIELICSYSSVSRCQRFLEANASWLCHKFLYYKIVESVTVCVGQITEFCD